VKQHQAWCTTVVLTGDARRRRSTTALACDNGAGKVRRRCSDLDDGGSNGAWHDALQRRCQRRMKVLGTTRSGAQPHPPPHTHTTAAPSGARRHMDTAAARLRSGGGGALKGWWWRKGIGGWGLSEP